MGLKDLFGLTKPEPTPIGDLILMISKRAERLDPKQQADTFVSLGGVEKALLNADNRIIFGRRGTGKTHLLSFVADAARKKRETALQLDLRTMGSGSYLYADPDSSLSDSASRLLRDFVAAIHGLLLDEVTDPKQGHNVARLALLLDRLSNSVREIVVREEVEITSKEGGGAKLVLEGETRGKAALAFTGPTAAVEAKARTELETYKDGSIQVLVRGHVRLSVNLGSVHSALAEIAEAVGHRIWIFIDEWSVIPEIL